MARSTRTVEQKAAEYQTILDYLVQGVNPREIKFRLNLTKPQYNQHLADIMAAGELPLEPAKITYAMIQFGALHNADRSELNKRLELNLKDTDWLRFEKCGDNDLICYIITPEDRGAK